MDQDENDLQKAIDDITKNDVGSSSDVDLVAEIAAKFAEQAKTMPEGDTNKSNEISVGEAGFGAPDLPVPEMPGTNGGGMPPASGAGDFVAGADAASGAAAVGAQFVANYGGETGNNSGADVMAGTDNGEKNVMLGTDNSEKNTMLDADLMKVKNDALKELAPLVEKLDKSAEEKFALYVNILENLNDKTVVEKMYEAAKGIADDGKKAEALLKVVEILNKFSN